MKKKKVDNRARPSQPQEVLIKGWDAIGAMFGKTGRAMIHRKKELLDAGVVFYTHFGRPPRKMIAAFPTMLMRWTCEKSVRGEKI